ncbi:MAG: class I SAM-dependent methyltransferase [Micromonosporaceae bacterium]|nr:class I SAM-dependent methyltransferase [Micromonosporaceae bacterium]
MHELIHRRRRNLPNAFAGHPSRVYDFVARRVLRVVYRRVAADIATVAPQGAQVLDVGTGPGVLLVELAARRPDLRLTGVDLSADMVATARRNLTPFADRARAHVGDVTSLPFEDQSFDLIVSSISTHHWDDPEGAVPELARVLRPGGRVYIYDFPFAPFDRLATSAATHSVLNGQTPERSRLRTGVLFLPYVRFVMSA